MRNIMIAHDDTWGSGVTNDLLSNINLLDDTALTAYELNGTFMVGGGSDTPEDKLYFVLGRSAKEGVLRGPIMDVKSFEFVKQAAVPQVVYVAYLGDNGTTTTDYWDTYLGATPVAGEVVGMYITDKTKEVEDPLQQIYVEYVVTASDSDNDAVVTGLVAALNADEYSSALGTALMVGTAAGGDLGIKFTGVANADISITGGGIAGLVPVTDITAFVEGVNTYDQIAKLEQDLWAERPKDDTFESVNGMWGITPKAVVGKTYVTYVCTWYNTGNRLRERSSPDLQTFVLVIDTAASTLIGKVDNLMADIIAM